MKKLIITEKPSVAQSIARSLGGFKNREDHLESKDYLITWALGHLVALQEPEDYDKKYRFWTLQHLPIIPEAFKLKVIKETAPRFRAIAKLLKSKEVEAVINACDAGREGELIFRNIFEKAGGEKPILRLWLSSMTESAIKEAFRKLKPGSELELLAQAAKCRAESDWLVGINATRAFTRRFGTLLSVGRVQTPTLAILVSREREIQEFVPQKYFELVALFLAEEGEYQGKWFRNDLDRFSSFEEGNAVLTRVMGKEGRIAKLEKKESRQIPPLLFDLTELQREANRRFGFTARRTLNAAQNLYEEHKLITYPRTDCQFLGSDMIPELKEIISCLNLPPWEQFSQALLLKEKLPITKRIVDDSRLTDHHAIIPTPLKPDLGSLGADEGKIYDLVVRRFLSVFFPPAIWENTRIVTQVEGETFKTEGRKLIEEGWLKIYDPPKSDLLPELWEGESVELKRAELFEKETAPPPRYSDATLLSAMEGAGKLIEEEELRQAMKDRGLGTPATRAAIIERLIEVGYLEREGKSLVPTSKGMELIKAIESIPINELVSPDLTAEWEWKLTRIEKGEFTREEFMKGIIALTREIVEKVKAVSGEKTHPMKKATSSAIGKCPLCGGEVRENRAAFSCSNWKTGCKFVIWKKIAGKTITRKQAQTLLEKGKTGILSGFKSKKGKSFRAMLELEGNSVVLKFPNGPEKKEEKEN
ncbi:MAG: DNA topoisomerase 3 [Caldiserica bacterium]|jgi:DNA topoisomerase-3|nr:DNA topoisomerase 3 [Caldisericota bacterium]MDH7562573.1 DNA topoisomerase 3 [Caldisericota bacterium]